MALLTLITLAVPWLFGAQSDGSSGEEIQEHLRLAQKALVATSPDAATHEFEAILAIF